MVRSLFPLLIAGLLAGCLDNGVDDASVDQGKNSPGAYTVFDPDSGDIPYPNDILFAPNSSSTSDAGDGTLNIPYEASDADAVVKAALNTLDGFSTTSPISIGLTDPVDDTTLHGHVHLYKVATQASPETSFIPAVGAVLDELTYGTDFVAASDGNRLAVVPLVPLESHAGYMVVLTEGIADTDGRALFPDPVTSMLNGTKPLVDAQGDPTVYFDPDAAVNTQTARQLEGLRRLNQAMFAQLIGKPGMTCQPGAEGVTCENVIMAWSFTAQTIGQVQTALSDSPKTAQLLLNNTNETTKTFVPSLFGIADVYAGILINLPQYMPQASFENPMPALSGHFGFEGDSALPRVEANATVPAFATVPNGASGCIIPESGWPVVIYQHGITRSRTDLLAYAETFASRCYAAVAIDLPMHGVAPDNPLYMEGLERTFDLDVATEELNAQGVSVIVSYTPDDTVDSSGAHYMNLASLITTRDNMHQTTSDLMQLEHALGSAAGVTFDANRVHFVSHSLGTIASVGYVAQTQGLTTATLAMPGQQVVPLLDNSAVFGPIIEGGLAGAGVFKGTPEYDAFLLAAQTIVDDADPANYSRSIGMRDDLPLLLFEAVGNGLESSGDRHIPNRVPTAPLSGTDPFAAFVGAQELNVSATVDNPHLNTYFTPTSKTITRLVEGEHRSPLDPQYSLAATQEIHAQMLSFIDSNGSAIIVTDPSVIKE
jgi:pimeloyl-ACP methyl ester carboxylesterase